MFFNTSWGFSSFWSWNWFLQCRKYIFHSSNSLLCFIYSAIVLRGTYCTDIGTYCAKAKSESLKVLNHIKQCHPLFLISVFFIRKSLTELLHAYRMMISCVSDPHGASLTTASLDVRCLYEMRWGGLNAEQLQSPQHGASGCLYCCYYGDMPLHSLLCNKVLKFIFLRMKEQWASAPQREREIQREC